MKNSTERLVPIPLLARALVLVDLLLALGALAQRMIGLCGACVTGGAAGLVPPGR